MQKLGEFWKIQEICYMIGTRILKINSEIAEIIDAKVATPHLRNWYFAIKQRQKNYFYVTGGNFNLNYLSHFWIDFQNSCAYYGANFLNFSNLPQLLHFGWTLSEKMAKKVKTDLWDTLYNRIFIDIFLRGRRTRHTHTLSSLLLGLLESFPQVLVRFYLVHRRHNI